MKDLSVMRFFFVDEEKEMLAAEKNVLKSQGKSVSAWAM